MKSVKEVRDEITLEKERILCLYSFLHWRIAIIQIISANAAFLLGNYYNNKKMAIIDHRLFYFYHLNLTCQIQSLGEGEREAIEC